MRRRTGRNIMMAVGLMWVFAVKLLAGTGPSSDVRPDAVLSPPPFVVHPGAPALVHRFEIPAGQVKDRWIRAFRFQTCDPRLVQSAFFYVDKTGQWLGTWTPGETMISFPDTVAAWLPTASKIVMDIHYLSVNQDSDDCSSIGLYFTDKKPLRPLLGMGIQTPVEIPGGKALELKKEFTVIADSYAIAVQPEMRAAGRSVEVTAVDPSGTSQVLYGAKNLNGSAQSPQIFQQPIFIPRGTRIVATASYRNSDPQTAADDIFKLTMSLYPSAAFHPARYDEPITKQSAKPLKKVTAKKTLAPQTKKTTSRKSSSKKRSL